MREKRSQRTDVARPNAVAEPPVRGAPVPQAPSPPPPVSLGNTKLHDPAYKEAARRNRERFPEAAAFVDLVRSAWPGAEVVYFGPAKARPEGDRGEGGY